ncbi:hypothetical protein MYX84_12885 [Acidobacteria bacterium AH-259-O06]|nr:hypothetical protein [Acidobacteria bacterium AH-259-O06]
MSIVVSLRDVIGEMDALSDDHTAYLNPKTGELIALTEEEHYILENDEPPEDLPEWQRGMLPKIREVVESGDFLALPSKFDIHEYSIMERFCHSTPRRELQNVGYLLPAITRNILWRGL